jgi:hypothetical protein
MMTRRKLHWGKQMETQMEVTPDVEQYVQEVAARCPFYKLTALAYYTNRTPGQVIADSINDGLTANEVAEALDEFWSTTVN